MVPARLLQPKERELRYADVRSARAEEGILRVVLLDGGFFSQLDDLAPEDFSSPLLGKVYGILRRRWREGRRLALSSLEGECAPEELDQISAILQEPQPRNTAQAALNDCKETILTRKNRKDITGAQDLNALRDALKQKKGLGG